VSVSEPTTQDPRALGEFWNALPNQTATAPPESPPDPALMDLMETVRWVTSRDDAPAPDGAFVARLHTELLGTWPPELHILTIPASQSASLNRRLPPVVSPRSGRIPGPSRTPRFLGHVATAALLAVTILVSLVGLQLAPTSTVDPPGLVIIPIQVNDPATAQGLLTEVTVPELPSIAGYVGIERLTYPPRSDPVTTTPMTGPLLLLVTSGTLTVSLDGQGAMLSSQNTQPLVSTLATTTGEVAAGATLLVPAQTWLTTSNLEAQEAMALAVAINEDTMGDWVVPFNQTTIEHETLARSRAEFAPGEAGIALSRATLEPDASVPPPADGTFQLVAAESKFLGYLTRAPDGTATNREDETLGVLIAAISQPSAP
jgi:hypothetical protein